MTSSWWVEVIHIDLVEQVVLVVHDTCRTFLAVMILPVESSEIAIHIALLVMATAILVAMAQVQLSLVHTCRSFLASQDPHPVLVSVVLTVTSP